jgi:hypothetical protein
VTGGRAALPACSDSKTDAEGAFKPASAFPEPLHFFFSLVSDWLPPKTTDEVITKEGMLL